MNGKNCVWSGVCGIASPVCDMPGVATAENCGFIEVEVRKQKTSTLPVAFCVSSAWCSYWKHCTPEFIRDFGCAAIDEAVAKKKTVVAILLEKIQKEQGYYTEGPWFNALQELSPNGGIDAAQKAAWMRNTEMKFGVRYIRSVDLSLLDDEAALPA
ncbi:MAG: hypothetical protein NTY61_03800 [Candidatus Parcubacteria bacterium]|nr:hypothetical protein [Candidatus Parcubacteria bacterium]